MLSISRYDEIDDIHPCVCWDCLGKIVKPNA